MSTRTETFKMELDVSNVIEGYKRALEQMRQAGGNSRAMESLERQINSIERSFEDLQRRGERGFFDVSDMQKQSSSIQRTFTRLENAGRRFRDIVNDGVTIPGNATAELNRQIQQVEQRINSIQGAMSQRLRDVGFSGEDSDRISQNLTDRIELERELTDEFIRRLNAEAEARTAAGDEERRIRFSTAATHSNMVSNQLISNAYRQGSSAQEIAQQRENVNRTIANAIREQNSSVQGVIDAIQTELGGDAEGFFSDWQSFQQRIEDVFHNMERQVQNSTEQRIYDQARQSRELIGDIITDEDGYHIDNRLNQNSQDIIDSLSLDDIHTLDEQRAELQRLESQRESAAQQDTQTVNNLNDTMTNLITTTRTEADANEALNSSLINSAHFAQQADNNFEQLKSTLLQFFSLGTIFNSIRTAIKQTYEDVKELDKSFASIAMVTSYSIEHMWDQYSTYADMASKLGQTTNDIVQASALFYQQGLDTEEALELTTNTMKLATLAGNDFQTATQEMTAAIRGFKMEMSEGASVTDVYSELAAHAAARVDDIAKAMSRTASIANSAGMSFENTSAFLTQMIETTQESAENIGTSLKTIIARFTELKKNIAGTSESEFDDLELNKVDKALKSVGVDLKTATGQFRNLDDVFTELSKKWSTLDRNTQRYVATIAAGSRQQSRFIAMMDNYERTAELMELAANAEGKADEQFAKYADTLEYKLKQIKTKWEEFRVWLLDSDFFGGILDQVNKLLDRLQGLTDLKKLIPAFALGAYAGKQIVTGFLSTFGQLKNMVTRRLGDILNKLSTRLSSTRLGAYIVPQVRIEQLNTQLNGLRNEIDAYQRRYGSINYSVFLNMSDVQSGINSISELENAFRRAGIPEQEFENQIRQLNATLGTSIPVTRENAQVTQQDAEALRQAAAGAQSLDTRLRATTNQMQQVTSRLNIVQQSISTVTTMAISGITTFASGMGTANDAIKVMAMSATSLIPTLFRATKAGMDAARAGSSAFAAFAAAGGAATLIVVGIGVAIAGVMKLIEHFKKKNEEAKRSLIDERNEAEALTQSLKENTDDAKTKAKTERESVKNIEDLRQKYEKLQSKVALTTEEQDEYNELIKEIQDKYPEIISYYDEMNNKLYVQNDLWQGIINKANALYKEDSRIAAARSAAERSSSRSDAIAGITYAADKYDEMLEVYKLASKKTQNLTVHWTGAEYVEDLRKWYNEYSKSRDFNFDDFLEYSGINDKIAEFKDIEGMDEDYLIGQYVSDFGRVSSNYKDHFAEIEDALQQKKDQVEQSAAINKQLNDLNKAELEAEKSYTAEYAKNTLGFSDFTAKVISNMTDVYNTNDISEKLQGIAKQISLGETDFLSASIEGVSIEKILGSLADNYKEDTSKYGSAVYNTLRAYYQTLSLEAIDITEEEDARINNVMSELTGKTASEIRANVNSLAASFTGDRVSIGDAIRTTGEGIINDIEGTINSINEAYGFAFDPDNFTKETADALKGSMQTMVDDYGAGVAKQMVETANRLQGNIEGFNEEVASYFYQFNWNNIDIGNSAKSKQEMLDKLAELLPDPKDAAKVVEEFWSTAIRSGALSAAIGSEAALDSLEDTIAEQLTGVVDAYSKIKDVLKNQFEKGYIDFSDMEKLKKELKEIGLDAKDYLSYNSSGQLVLDEQKLTNTFKEQATQESALLEFARQETRQKMDELQVEIAILKGQQGQLEIGTSQIDTEEKLLQLVADRFQFLKEMGYIESDLDVKQITSLNSIGKFNTEITKTGQEAIDTLQEQYDAYEKFYKNDLVEGSEYAKRLQKQAAAAYREIQDIRNDALPDEQQVKSVKDAEEDLTKALKAQADAEEDLAKKQQDLNDKLKEYNDLLYGSDNRKSSLDLLYNYEEAINSFNDEISRSKDLMSTATSITDSADALNRYANATHNLLVEEKARQKVLQSGLNNYASMIENGNYAYTDMNGNTTNVNFGDYAKKDSRTGKYMINQRLINESKFGDKIKELLEEQVSNYNKYADELLKSEDNVRKVEKELQDERLAALKNYTQMESDLADALKAQYEEEVNQLKNKYDSMKDADDDYITALKKAIDKQKKLRERESKYEDLATKEKKLSLMMRDTSGANALENQKLEKDIQKDREDLLDEAINDIVDSLSELYESQQELKEEEIALKEALVDNTLYWNLQAESLAGSFKDADEYAKYLSSISKDYANMTLAMQQEKLAEYGDTYTQATEYMAMQAMDATSETGDFVIDVVSTTGSEVADVVTNTAEVFSTEVIRAYNETTAAFEADMQKAVEAINEANKSLQEAIDKLNECGIAANKAAQALADANANAGLGNDNPPSTEGTSTTGVQIGPKTLEEIRMSRAAEIASIIGMPQQMIQGIINNNDNKEAIKILNEQLKNNRTNLTSDQIQKIKDLGYFVGSVNDSFRIFETDRELGDWLRANANGGHVKRYLSGGLVDQTGFAYVDGTTEKPEAFLNANDTKNIGEAVQILRDIPYFNGDYDRTAITNNNGGDVNIEVNMNIENVNSDVDMDRAIDTMKEKIVEAARPIGSSVILQQ